MGKIGRNFLGIWIPADIWLAKDLPLLAKVLFVEIESLDNEKGCFASNRYFAEFFGVGERQIRNIIGILKEKGFILVSVKDRNERTIRVAPKYRRVKPEKIGKIMEAKEGLSRKWGIDNRRRG